MRYLLLATAALCTASGAFAQGPLVQPGAVLDPSRTIQHDRTIASFHQPLPEQYIWTANDAAVATGEKQLSQLKLNDWHVSPHRFRAGFNVVAKPSAATLYIAGPRSAKVWLNGVQVANLHYSAAHHSGFGTMTVDVTAALKPGSNVIAIEAVRGYGSHHHTNALYTSWLTSGEVLTAKIIPAAEGIEAQPILISDTKWKSAVDAKEGWQQPAFDDSNWRPVVSLGGIESSVDFFQWNADTGLYNWPGYLGEAPYMANYLLEPVTTKQVPQGTLLDFGRELNGRIFIPASAQAAKLTVQLGESMGELLNAPYLGEIALTAPPNTAARGPKTGFRYALIGGPAPAPKILAEGIYYPAPQIGAFESSDFVVNKIFETAVYTAHLSMQDSILDGIKRDRGRWIGDDEVINRVIADVYADPRLIKEGLEDAIGPDPVTEHVNGLPGYSAWWVVAEYEYIARFGDLDQFRAIKPRLLQLLARMEKELDARHVYVNTGGGKPFVDWSKGFSGDSPEARRAMDFEYSLAFGDASFLFLQTGDDTQAGKYLKLSQSMYEAARKYLAEPDESFGDRWQTNALAVLADFREGQHGVASDASWKILERAVTGRKPTDVITPYFGSYLLQALARGNDRPGALKWLTVYWGGMLDNGATSFWEAWDPAWAGPDPHAKLEADDKVGYNASLAHGWSSGPAAWLLEEVLGVKCMGSGCKDIVIHPDLAGLTWVNGTVATPYGQVGVSVRKNRVAVTIPPGVDSELRLPEGQWERDGVKVPRTGPLQTTIFLNKPGRFEFVRN